MTADEATSAGTDGTSTGTDSADTGGGVRPFGLTVVLQAGHDAEALRFYGALFGRPPDFSPHEGFHERQNSRDARVEVTAGCQPHVPAVSRMRFQVADLTAAAAVLGRHGIAVAP